MPDSFFEPFMLCGWVAGIALTLFVPLVFISTLLFAFCEPRTKTARLACFLVPTMVVLTGFLTWFTSLHPFRSPQGDPMIALTLLGPAGGIAAAARTMTLIRRKVLLEDFVLPDDKGDSRRR